MDVREVRRFNRRARLILSVFLGLLGLVAVRSAQLQIVQHDRLTRLAREQYLNTVKIPARRGHIYDRNNTPLAISVDVPSVYANPGLVTDARGSAKKLARVLSMDVRNLEDRLESERYFVWLKRQVTPAVADKVRALNLPGISISKEPRRFYPNRDVAAHVIGFAGLDGRGLEGIEKQFDSALLGEPQTVPAVRDARGNAVLAGGLDPAQRARGEDVQLTLDAQLQHSAEVALDRVMRATRARSASAVVLDVTTAEVLALAIAPQWNPNEGNKTKPDRRRNRVITDMYEPGSTLKPLVVGAALDAGVINSRTSFFCEKGRFAIGGHTIRDTSSHEWMTPTEILAKSSNIGMAKIAQKLGRAPLEHALRDFGFGKRTGAEFPGEVNGLLRPNRAWSELEFATISFGQGMAVNSLQLAAAYRVLAANGVYKEPRLVRAVLRPDGAREELPPSPERQVLSIAAAQRVTAMLESAIVPKEGTGKLANIPGYRAAGKTGTAQKADPLTHGYSRDKYIALFAGYAPAEAPKVVIVVSVDEPQTSHLGGVVAAPVFAEIGSAALSRLGVVASNVEAPVTAATVESALAEANVVQEPVPEVDTVDLTPGSMPSFIGLTGRQAVQRYAKLGGGSLEMEGTGRVVRQEPKAGTRRAAGRVVRLKLAAD